ncbi:MAG TPA: extracellular solute-binding protein, partial [Nitrososphaera sp.]|nr:extracellular solute-binding protein [Nitrososphaera sp.]
MRRRALIAVICLLLLPLSNVYAKQFTVWHTENDPQTIEALNTIARRFEAANPDVQVQMVSVGWDDLYRKLVLAVQSGQVPDLTQIEPFMAAYFYQAGQLQPLDDVERDIGGNDIFP